MLDTECNIFNIGNGSMQSDLTIHSVNQYARVENDHTMLEMNAGGYFIYPWIPVGRLDRFRNASRLIVANTCVSLIDECTSRLGPNAELTLILVVGEIYNGPVYIAAT